MPLTLPSLGYSSAQSLTTAQVNQAFNNLKRQNVAFLLKWGPMTAAISSVARASNVATIVTSVAHGMIVGQKVNIDATTDSTFDAGPATILSVPSTTSFTYASTGSDKGTTADSGTLYSWEIVNDGTHTIWGGPYIQSITSAAITIGFTSLPDGRQVLAASLGNHAGSSELVPAFAGVGLSTIAFEFRQRLTLSGRVYWNGTTTGGGITANANWVKEGDSGSLFFDAANSALLIAHSPKYFATLGSRGASSYPIPSIGSAHSALNPHLPNYQVSPFTAAGYQPSATGFYFQIYDASGTLMDQTALEAISPASRLQFTWSRSTSAIIDHTLPPTSVLVWADVWYWIP